MEDLHNNMCYFVIFQPLDHYFDKIEDIFELKYDEHKKNGVNLN